MVLVRSVRTATLTEAGSLACSCFSRSLMLSTTLMMLAPGCRWMLRITAGVVFIHAAWLHVLRAHHDAGHIGQAHRSAILVGDDRCRRIPCGSSSWSLAPMVNDCRLSSKLPLA